MIIKYFNSALLLLFLSLPIFGKNTLLPDESLDRGNSLVSLNGLYKLTLQEDGNLVLYQKNKAIWFTGTQGQAIQSLTMQTDGNAVLYKYSGASAWDSKTSGNPNSYLVLQDDGNLVVYKRVAIFSTLTSKK